MTTAPHAGALPIPQDLITSMKTLSYLLLIAPLLSGCSMLSNDKAPEKSDIDVVAENIARATEKRIKESQARLEAAKADHTQIEKRRQELEKLLAAQTIQANAIGGEVKALEATLRSLSSKPQ
ncbi:MAG: hypothetical protein CMK00_01295 [Planctomycetes bacterium]|nr:hypothetical protein [Planctomycetota bacterium]